MKTFLRGLKPDSCQTQQCNSRFQLSTDRALSHHSHVYVSSYQGRYRQNVISAFRHYTNGALAQTGVTDISY
jgi:hypothetical protein